MVSVSYIVAVAVDADDLFGLNIMLWYTNWSAHTKMGRMYHLFYNIEWEFVFSITNAATIDAVHRFFSTYSRAAQNNSQ